MVGLLTLYSNHADQGKRFQRLLDLPQRADQTARPVPRSRRRPTRADCVELVTGYQAGETIRQLADRFGFHRETVSRVLERAGVCRRYHLPRGVDLDQADDLYAAGLSITEVAEVMGIGRTTLIKARRARTQAT